MRKPCFLILVLFLLPLFFLESQSRNPGEQNGIISNAQGGSFSKDQEFWFSVSGAEKIRILIDRAEVYAGPGPTSITLKADQGEERTYNLTAERRASFPDDTLLEVKQYIINIDKKPPENPRVIPYIDEQSKIRFRCSNPVGEISQGVIDSGAEPFFVSNLNEASLPLISFSAVVWAKDPAGNCSVPRDLRFDFPPVRVENPRTGTWANPQRLIIENISGYEIFWTSDGSDPFGETGTPYTSPVRIDKTGDVSIRIGIRQTGGISYEEKIDYSVLPPPELLNEDTVPSFLRTLQSLEENPVETETSVGIPGDFLWSFEGISPFPGDEQITLRPQERIRRYVFLQAGKNGYTTRYAILLEGKDSGMPEVPQVSHTNQGDVSLGSAPSPDAVRPRMAFSGNSRVVYWPGDVSNVWYRLSNDQVWLDGKKILPLPIEGGTLEWIIQDETNKEPFKVAVDPVPQIPKEKDQKTVQGYFSYRYKAESLSAEKNPADNRFQWIIATPVLELNKDVLGQISLDACDGEDMEWQFVSGAGETLKSWHKDRRKPKAPVLEAPSPDSWQRDARISVVIDDNDPDTEAVLLINTEYDDGSSELFKVNNFVQLLGKKNQVGLVNVEAYLVDSSGNKSRSSFLRFTLDPSIIYVAGNVSPVKNGNPDGSRERPFQTLDEAIALALKEGRRVIYVAETAAVKSRLSLSGEIVINGGFDGEWKPAEYPGTLRFDPTAGITLEQGKLTFYNTSIEWPGNGKYLIEGNPGSAITMIKSRVSGTGPLIRTSRDCNVYLEDCSISASVKGPGRSPYFYFDATQGLIRDTVITLDETHGLVLHASASDINITGSAFVLKAEKTGTLFSIDSVNFHIQNINASVTAEDYSSAVESVNSNILIQDSLFSVKSRDGTVLILDRSETSLVNTELQLNTSFLAQAVQIKGNVPGVTGCSFIFTGSSSRSNVFSGIFSNTPDPKKIGGNTFIGFSHILNDNYPAESIMGFNRDYAPQGKNNLVSTRKK